MVPIKEIRFQLAISAGDYLAYYRGEVREVAVRAADGRSIRSPANILRPFLSHTGVNGEFALQYDEQNRFVGIRKLGTSSG